MSEARISQVLCLAIVVATIVSDDTVRNFDTLTHAFGYGLYTNWWKLIGPAGTGPLRWLTFNAMEVLILVATTAILLERRTFVVTPELVFGGAFLVAVATMFAYGVLSGGEIKPALWQVRPFVHIVLLAALFPQAFRTANDLTLAIRVTILAILWKAAHAIGIFLLVAHARFFGWRELVGHEDSVFFVAAMAFLFALFLYDRDMRGRLMSAVSYLLALAALVLNLRRAGYAAYGVTIVLMPIILHCRRRIAFALTLAAFAATAIYVALFRDASGTLAVPAKKILSSFASSGSGDFSSNLYRYAENINLWQMIKSHPLGTGFGIPFETVVPIADLSANFPYFRYSPHNMIFGLWMPLGTVGFIVFLSFFAATMLSAIVSIRTAQPIAVKCAAVFCASGLAAALVASEFDQFVWAERGALFTGILVGLVAAIAAHEGRSIWIIRLRPRSGEATQAALADAAE